jgi:hypothetical protein
MKKDLSIKGKIAVSEWVKNNESTLIPVNPTDYNYYTSGKNPKHWKRRSQGESNGRTFRIFSKDGPQDLNRIKDPKNWKPLHMPNELAVVWFENNEVVDLEWKSYDEVLLLDPNFSYF